MRPAVVHACPDAIDPRDLILLARNGTRHARRLVMRSLAALILVLNLNLCHVVLAQTDAPPSTAAVSVQTPAVGKRSVASLYVRLKPGSSPERLLKKTPGVVTVERMFPGEKDAALADIYIM